MILIFYIHRPPANKQKKPRARDTVPYCAGPLRADVPLPSPAVRLLFIARLASFPLGVTACAHAPPAGNPHPTQADIAATHARAPLSPTQRERETAGRAAYGLCAQSKPRGQQRHACSTAPTGTSACAGRAVASHPSTEYCAGVNTWSHTFIGQH
jgi:hypothetical protein